MPVTEIVTFDVAPGTTQESVSVAANEMTSWLRQQPGFRHRTLAHVDGVSWVDIVHWDSMRDAQQAAERVMADLESCDFMQLVLPESVSMIHATHHVSVEA